MDPLTAVVALSAVAGFGSAWQMRRRALRAEARLARMSDELRAERYAAGHDPLTGLPNRRTFHSLGNAMLAAATSGQPLAAVVLDLDDFKLVNDRYGHAAGDEVLVTVARRFAAYANGDLVARMGGDEFAGLIHGGSCDEGWLRQTARRLANTVAAPMRVAGRPVRITASVGLAPVSRGTHLMEALQQADAEMYRAKARRQRDERYADTDRYLDAECYFDAERYPDGEPYRDADGMARPAHEGYRAFPRDPEKRSRPINQRRTPGTSSVPGRHLVDTSPTPSPDLGGS